MRTVLERKTRAYECSMALQTMCSVPVIVCAPVLLSGSLKPV
jgi:hypothetical protein